MSEFCAHEDEENQSQELARRLHLLPPVCGPAVSHADRVPLRPPAQQSFPPGSLQLGRFFFIITIIRITTSLLFDSLSNPVAERSVSRNRLRAYSVHIGAYLRCLSPSLSVAALIYRRDGLCRASGFRRANTVLYTAINLHSDVAKTLPPRLKLPYKLSMKK